MLFKISNNEYLIGWHGVTKNDFKYLNGLAIVSSEGELLSISNYLLALTNIYEIYGDRPFVIFGWRLVRYKELLMWIGGVADTFIEVFLINFDKIFEYIKWIRS